MSNQWESYDRSGQGWSNQSAQPSPSASTRSAGSGRGGRKPIRTQTTFSAPQPARQSDETNAQNTGGLQQSTFADLAGEADSGQVSPWQEFGLAVDLDGEGALFPATGRGATPVSPRPQLVPAEMPEATAVGLGPSRIDPQTVWQMALAELALQMTSATYDTWVRDTSIMAYEDGEFIIGAPNSYARDWLDNRLRATIKRTLGGIMRRSVQVNFRVKPQPAEDTELTEETPLYQPVQSVARSAQAPAQPLPNRLPSPKSPWHRRPEPSSTRP